MPISDPEHISERLKKLPGDIRRMVEARVELFILESSETVGDAAGKVVMFILTLIILIFGVLFALIALSVFVGDVLQNPAGGYLVTASLLFVAALLVYLLVPHIIGDSIKKSIFKSLSDKKKELPPPQNGTSEPNAEHHTTSNTDNSVKKSEPYERNGHTEKTI